MMDQPQERNRLLVIDKDAHRYQQIRAVMEREHLLESGNFSLDTVHDMDRALDRMYSVDYRACFIDEEFLADESETGALHAMELMKRHRMQIPTVLMVDSAGLEIPPEAIHWLESGFVRVLPSDSLRWSDIYRSIVDLLLCRAAVLVATLQEDQYFFIADQLIQYPDLGFSPEWAASFDDAVVKLRQGQYDVLILDQDLGPMRGTDLLNAIPLMGLSIPAVLCTGRDRIALDEQALRLLGRRQMQFISRSRIQQSPSALARLCARQLRLQ